MTQNQNGANDVHDDNLGLVGTENFIGVIPHYYGDAVRQLFIAAAALILVTAPFYAELTPYTTITDIVSALVLACLAALTSPRLRSVLLLDACAAGAGLLVYESAAVSGYSSGDLVMFVMRQALAIIFLFALYNSVKTLRSMLLNRVAVDKRAHVAWVAAEAAEAHAEDVQEKVASEEGDSRPGDMKHHDVYDD